MITQHQRWVPGPPRIRCSDFFTEEDDSAFMGVQKCRSSSYKSKIYFCHGAFGALAVKLLRQEEA